MDTKLVKIQDKKNNIRELSYLDLAKAYAKSEISIDEMTKIDNVTDVYKFGNVSSFKLNNHVIETSGNNINIDHEPFIMSYYDSDGVENETYFKNYLSEEDLHVPSDEELDAMGPINEEDFEFDEKALFENIISSDIDYHSGLYLDNYERGKINDVISHGPFKRREPTLYDIVTSFGEGEIGVNEFQKQVDNVTDINVLKDGNIINSSFEINGHKIETSCDTFMHQTSIDIDNKPFQREAVVTTNFGSRKHLQYDIKTQAFEYIITQDKEYEPEKYLEMLENGTLELEINNNISNENMSFREYLEEIEGIDWEYYDNNYDGIQADEIWDRYINYLDSNHSIDKEFVEQKSITDIFNSNDIAGELIALKESGQYKEEPYATVLKEVWDLINVEQNPAFHPEGDAFNHTMGVVRSMQQDLNGEPDQILAALAHDFGKASTTIFNEKKGVIVAYGHDKAGIEPSNDFIEKIGAELGLDRETIDNTKEYVANMTELHMQPMQLASNEKAKDDSYNKMFDKSIDAKDLIKLFVADTLNSSSKDKAFEYQNILEQKLESYEKLMEQPHVTKEMLQALNVPENKLDEMYDFAHKLHVSGLDLDKQLRQTFGQFKVELTKDMLDKATNQLNEQDIYKDSQYVRECLTNAALVRDNPNEPSLLDYIVNQRLDGPSNAGSDFGITNNVELVKTLYQTNWHEVEDPDVKGNKKVFEADIPGNVGICSIENLPEDTTLYAIDPKHTGNVMIGAANIPKTETEVSHIIISQASEPGQKDVVVTAFPGPVVADQSIPETELQHGKAITIEEAKAFGFDTVKYISPEMERELSLINQEIEKTEALEEEVNIEQNSDYQGNSQDDWDPLCDD